MNFYTIMKYMKRMLLIPQASVSATINIQMSRKPKSDTKNEKIYKNLWSKCDTECYQIRVITKLLNSEQSYKGKVKTHKYINRQNQSTTGKL